MTAHRPAALRRLPFRILSLLCAGLLPFTAAHAATKHAHPAHPAASTHAKHAAGGRATSRTAAKSSARGGRSVRGGSRAVASARGKHGRTVVVHEAVNPAARLDTISDLSYSLAHGTSAMSHPVALESFYAALANEQADPTATVRVLQYGDSHTAADMFTGEARRVFQGQFGNGGVGFSYPGHPFAGYRIYGSQRAQSSGWTTQGTHFLSLGDAKLGLSGLALNTYSSGQWTSLDTPCATFDLDYLKQPGGGMVQVADNGAVVGEVSTAADISTEGGTWHYDCPAGTDLGDHHFTVTTDGSAPVRLFGTTTLRPGVTWEAMGMNGAQAPLILDWYQPIFTSYLGKTDASLVVLAYGTNEAAAPHWTYELYSETFGHIIDLIHTTLPTASILVLGPADRSLAAKRRGYAPFSGTEHIVEAQRDVCRTHNCTFWDTQKRMGGFGAMQRWVHAGWAQHDHTHLNGEGYRVLADALMADLLSGYDSYRTAHGLLVTPAIRGGSPVATQPVSTDVPR